MGPVPKIRNRGYGFNVLFCDNKFRVFLSTQKCEPSGINYTTEFSIAFD